MENEIWLPIPGYEGLYEASTMGRFKTLKPNNKGVSILKPYLNSNGYLYITLEKDRKRKKFRCHRLIAKMFIENPDNLPEVNHDNGDKTDNRVKNLEWSTPKGNVQHAIRTGLRKTGQKEIPLRHYNGYAGMKRIDQYTLDGTFVRTYDSLKEAAIELNMGISTISKALTGIKPTGKGFIWKYNTSPRPHTDPETARKTRKYGSYKDERRKRRNEAVLTPETVSKNEACG